MNVGSPGSGGDAGVDLAGREQIELSAARWDQLHLEPFRSLPVAHAAHPFGEPIHGFRVETILIFKEPSRPDRRRRQPVLHADAFSVQVGGRTDAGALVDVNIRVAKHRLTKIGMAV